MEHYVTDEDGQPVEATLEEWGEFMRTADRSVRNTELYGLRVSTVFLGIDHGPTRPAGPPILWETMVFADDTNFSGDEQRYESREDAIAGHEAKLSRIKTHHPIARMLHEWMYIQGSGYQPCFTHDLFSLLRKADASNRCALSKVYPIEAKLMGQWESVRTPQEFFDPWGIVCSVNPFGGTPAPEPEPKPEPPDLTHRVDMSHAEFLEYMAKKRGHSAPSTPV